MGCTMATLNPEVMRSNRTPAIQNKIGTLEGAELGWGGLEEWPEMANAT